ncbi:potassium transporter Trk [Thalassobacillus devorans]|uniref:Potassium transporter Trk n=1 Tax=Thalassobacillus devorans TaxID=279813 RepID=A0ABQ1PEA8_9BACI|nr:TrkA family potassium uptake protein [Thalassobacillus devorans]NIK29280.1 trk system potassium uptake protein TrkA [Thalassobacillus devorans]GGC95470.1 potassium transporter Trk [Thalassobacillus devorans]
MKRKPERKQFAVIGLGRFGGSLCKELARLGVDVLALDKNLERVQEYSTIASHTAELDAIDEDSLKAVGIRNFDYVMISLGEGIQSSILATLMLKEMGIKQVWVKANDAYHEKVLKKIGADKIIHPERDMAFRIANHIVSEKITDYIELSDEYSIIEIIASEKVANKSLLELEIRSRYNCSIIAVKKSEDHILISPSLETKIDNQDILVTIGNNEDLDRFQREGV